MQHSYIGHFSCDVEVLQDLILNVEFFYLTVLQTTHCEKDFRYNMPSYAVHHPK